MWCRRRSIVDDASVSPTRSPRGSPAAAGGAAAQSPGTDVSSMLAHARALAGGHRATFDALDEPQATLTSRGARRPVSRGPSARREGAPREDAVVHHTKLTHLAYFILSRRAEMRGAVLRPCAQVSPRGFSCRLPGRLFPRMAYSQRRAPRPCNSGRMLKCKQLLGNAPGRRARVCLINILTCSLCPTE
jgi:hypothetical protein